MLELIFFGLALIGLITVANIVAARGNKIEKLIFNWLLFLLNGPVLLIGLMMMALPDDLMTAMPDELAAVVGDLRSAGLILVLMAAWGMLVTIPPVRKLLARVMPLDPGSPVHTLALLMVGYLIGQGALALNQGGLSGLEETAVPTSILLFTVSELFFALLAFLGVGFLIRRRGRPLLQRLGLERPQPLHLLAGSGLIIILVIMQAIAGVVWALLNPEQAELLEDVNTLLLADIDTLWEWLLLAMAAGIGEELLFRGALQPVFGLGFTSVIFALVHVQYGLTPVTLFIVLLAVILGLVRRYSNTTIAIFVHVGYNFVLGLLALLAAFLQQYVS